MTDYNNTEISSAHLNTDTSDVVAQATRGIEELRTRIDGIDDQIILLLAQRFQATEKVGELKAAAGFAALDATREAHQLERMSALAEAHGLKVSIAHAYRDFVVTQSKKRHEEIAEQAQ
ncbi:chorismate mutase [Alloscardovia criceti]|uniref:chorismate mutase n=1 Tax=Alloscardovia criceti TaxID=356828 RepID=UPI000380BDD4|nr:chorismate mutase [Alloscardovia criceti]